MCCPQIPCCCTCVNVLHRSLLVMKITRSSIRYCESQQSIWLRIFGHLADASLDRKEQCYSHASCPLPLLSSRPSRRTFRYTITSIPCFSRSGIGIVVVGRKWRGPVSQYGFFSSLQGFFPSLIAYPTRKNWRNLYRIISLLPLSFSVLSFPFVSESPRWLLVREGAMKP
uniref:Major facilitator superfamily (MFS) profile domain-containing protein n=1 Tax=Salix viminalis TaxID=40686 RepID=A0A6N2LL18_SALVM